MKIEDGYNDKPLELRISTQPNGSIELWINIDGETEKLSYLTPDELHDLYKEVRQAGLDLFN